MEEMLQVANGALRKDDDGQKNQGEAQPLRNPEYWMQPSGLVMRGPTNPATTLSLW